MSATHFRIPLVGWVWEDFTLELSFGLGLWGRVVHVEVTEREAFEAIRAEQDRVAGKRGWRELGADGIIPFARITGGHEEEVVAQGKKMVAMAAQVMALKEGGERANLEKVAWGQITRRGFLPSRKWRSHPDLSKYSNGKLESQVFCKW